uniref:Oligoribonuclease n=1 Tax=Candidatus Kentrum sp. TC TaxID=2126339 RepID=A0A451A247_9GAMM|nr:MAG: oligoribonuclease [Candidatus Kentron sp. TC]VFK46408.1 MAG: oligoribonuclease [Candidatus Kentron sp. TC]VFK60108.1 MAG: oligoribonuclease [Candidatus Kentron sp. TC]
MTKNTDNLIWIDLEMTGLDPDTNYIIEIATVITNSSLKVIAQGPVLAIWQSDEILNGMDAWNTNQHGKSGLIDRVRCSTHHETEAEQTTLDFVSHYVAEGKSPMCGNSISLDRRFLIRYMPKLAGYFHYRNLDVSTLKELCKRWARDVYKGFKKNNSHLALDDIYESIDELKYYREHLFKPPFSAENISENPR